MNNNIGVKYYRIVKTSRVFFTYSVSIFLVAHTFGEGNREGKCYVCSQNRTPVGCFFRKKKVGILDEKKIPPR